MNTHRRNWIKSVGDLIKVARDQVVEIKRAEEKEILSLQHSLGVTLGVDTLRENVAMIEDVISLFDEVTEVLQAFTDT